MKAYHFNDPSVNAFIFSALHILQHIYYKVETKHKSRQIQAPGEVGMFTQIISDQ